MAPLGETPRHHEAGEVTGGALEGWEHLLSALGAVVFMLIAIGAGPWAIPLALGLLGAAAWWWGVDSRDPGDRNQLGPQHDPR